MSVIRSNDHLTNPLRDTNKLDSRFCIPLIVCVILRKTIFQDSARLQFRVIERKVKIAVYCAENLADELASKTPVQVCRDHRKSHRDMTLNLPPWSCAALVKTATTVNVLRLGDALVEKLDMQNRHLRVQSGFVGVSISSISMPVDHDLIQPQMFGSIVCNHDKMFCRKGGVREHVSRIDEFELASTSDAQEGRLVINRVGDTMDIVKPHRVAPSITFLGRRVYQSSLLLNIQTGAAPFNRLLNIQSINEIAKEANLLTTAYDVRALNALREGISVKSGSNGGVDAVLAKQVVKIVHACDKSTDLRPDEPEYGDFSEEDKGFTDSRTD
ncbi:hypothetical protein KCV06_g445, partial [Aureobasidium melanogenum]